MNFLPRIPPEFWDPRAVDTAGELAVGALLFFGVLWLLAGTLMRVVRLFSNAPKIVFKQYHGLSNRQRIRATRWLRQRAVVVGGVVVTLLTTFVGYATFRAGNMLTALQYLSDQSNHVGEMEVQIPEAICIYRWGERYQWGDTPRGSLRDGCSSDIFVTADHQRLASSFDDIQLYIEESLLYFIQADIYRNRYDANYYEGLRYWAQDFSEDWTGAVSFYVVSREIDNASGSRVDARSIACLERFARIPPIEDICDKYYRFLGALGAAGNGFRSTTVRCEGVSNDRAELLTHESPDFCDRTWWGVNFVGKTPLETHSLHAR